MKFILTAVISLLLIFSVSPALAQDESGGLDLNVTYDLGASAGSVGEVSYFEANVGLNLSFTEEFVWRNAIFYRTYSHIEPRIEDIYGLDTSGRFYYRARFSRSTGIVTFIGAGARIPNTEVITPLAEVGITFHLAGLRLGGGAKTFFNSVSNRGAKNDTQFFIILAGGGSL